jgi:tryptophan-rich hypothetical protein
MLIKPLRINPKKLLNSKWTAVTPLNKEKHFMVSKLLQAELPQTQLEFVELEAVYSKRKQILPWTALTDASLWLQGWV